MTISLTTHEFVFIQLRTFGRVASARWPNAKSTSSGKPISRATNRKNGIRDLRV